jgi:hypothetical protein
MRGIIARAYGDDVYCVQDGEKQNGKKRIKEGRNGQTEG